MLNIFLGALFCSFSSILFAVMDCMLSNSSSCFLFILYFKFYIHTSLFLKTIVSFFSVHLILVKNCIIKKKKILVSLISSLCKRFFEYIMSMFQILLIQNNTLKRNQLTQIHLLGNFQIQFTLLSFQKIPSS